MKSCSFRQTLTTALCLLATISQVFCQGGHQMLVENCNWKKFIVVQTSPPDSKETLEMPSVEGHNFVTNLTCSTQIIIPENPFKLNVKVYKFDLMGTDICTSSSERLTFQVPAQEGGAGGNITWCGRYFAHELLLPLGEVHVSYNTGAFGEGSGFLVEFSAVPSYTCYEWTKLNATSQPGLLYSPNFPAKYLGDMHCSVTLTAPPGFYIRVRSLMIDIEVGHNCEYDYLQIGSLMTCGTDPVDHVVPSSVAEIGFKTDYNTEGLGYILEYSAIKAEVVDCSEGKAQYSITITEDTLVVLDSGVKESSSTDIDIYCEVSIKIGGSISSRRVLSVTFPEDMSVIKNQVIKVDGDNLDNSGQCEIHEALRYLRSPGGWIIFAGQLVGRRVMLKVEAVDEALLPATLTAGPSMIWIDKDMLSGGQQLKLHVLADKTYQEREKEKSIEVRVYDKQPDSGQVYSDADLMPVAQHLAVYNGPNETCFELTRNCSLGLREEKSIYSIKSDSLTIIPRRTIDGIWLFFDTTDAVLPPVSHAPTGARDFEFISRYPELNFRNLYCAWSVVNKPGFVIQLKAETNFDPDIMENSFVLRNDSSELLRYYRNTPDGNVYSSDPLQIIVSVNRVEENDYPMYFKFSYDILDKVNDIYPHECRNIVILHADGIQSEAVTPNYPDFYMRSDCTWIINKFSIAEDIVIDFPEISCSEYELNLYTGWTELGLKRAGDYCNKDSVKNTFEQNYVKIELVPKTGQLQAGFRFVYHTADVGSRNQCNSKWNLTDLAPATIQGRLPDSSMRDMDCSYYLYPSSYDTTIHLSVDKLEFSDPVTRSICSSTKYIDINVLEQTEFGWNWRKDIRLCGLDDERPSYEYPAGQIRIDVHWSQPPLTLILYELSAYVSRKNCRNCFLYASTQEAYITSRNYPERYPSRESQVWSLLANNYDHERHVIVLDILDFELEPESYMQCINDYVIIYDGEYSSSKLLGTFCGTVLPKQLVSSGPAVTIKFVTNEEHNYKGFRIKYFTKPDPQTDNSDGSVSGVMIGLVIGMILLILGVAATVLCLVRVRRQRRRLERNVDAGVNRPNGRAEPSVGMDRQNSSVFIVNPVIINANMAPPPYPGLASSNDMAELPPYSRSDYDPPDYTFRYDDDSEPEELPPPYTPPEPSAAGNRVNEYAYNNTAAENPNNRPVNRSIQLASDSDRAAHVTETNDYDDIDENEGEYVTVPTYSEADPPADDDEHYMSVFRTPTTTLDRPVYDLGGPVSESVYDDDPPAPPPAYESDQFLRNSRGHRDGERRRINSQSRGGHLGPL